MASWADVEKEAPELAARAKRALDRHIHKTLATIRRDGAPRISGTEVMFEDGDLWMGSMPRSLKAVDLRRDPRFALHSASEEKMAEGDAKLAGRVEEIEDEEVRLKLLGRDHTGAGAHLFRAEITELVVTSVIGDPPDRLVIESWHEGRGLSRKERR